PSVFDEQAILNLVGGSTLNLQLVTTIMDGDGDPATSSATITLISSGSSFVAIDDDGPNGVAISSSGTVTHAETPGAHPAEGTNASNSVLGTSLDPAILAKFNAIHDKGIDPDVTSLDNSAIG